MKNFTYNDKEYNLHTDIIAINEFCKAKGIKLSELKDEMFVDDLDSMIVLFKQSIRRWLRYNGREDELSNVDFENMFAEQYGKIVKYLFDGEFMPKANGVGEKEDIPAKKKK